MNLEEEDLPNHIEVPPSLSGERADKILAAHFPNISRSKLQIFFKEGKVYGEKFPIAAKERLGAGKTLELKWNDSQNKNFTALTPAIPLKILFEDEDILVIDKAPGCVVHSGNGVHEPTLTEIILSHGIALSVLGGSDRPGIVHRLDKETSGTMVLAKTDLAHQVLTEAFSSRNVQKVYHALVRGVPSIPSGSIQEAIARHPIHRTRMHTHTDGRSARSDWKILETFGENYSYLQVQIFTGRTHQIRVHMKHLGFPILGDKTYGYRHYAADPCSFDRVMLHAYQLQVPHPRSHQTMIFCAPLAEDFQKKLDFLKSYFHHS
ncbi:MAG: RluA family pseudouridine synthase [Puniceicoccales bacterium]|jgi:23S rRNA pseudouridine1911/1915/1917 synthase|nr:RluA family pseudouridine synthase [Puniceicoccales bacterium]